MTSSVSLVLSALCMPTYTRAPTHATDGNGFSIEFWMQPDTTTMESSNECPLLTFGSNSSSAAVGDWNLKLEQQGETVNLYLQYKGNQYIKSNSATIPTDAASTQTHFVVNVNETKVEFFVDGTTAKSWCVPGHLVLSVAQLAHPCPSPNPTRSPGALRSMKFITHGGKTTYRPTLPMATRFPCSTTN